MGPRSAPAGAAVDAGLSDEDAAEGLQHGPAAGAAQSRGVRGRLVGGVEAVGGIVRQEHPSGGEVAGRIARAEIAEVDHAAEGALRGEDVGRMQVAVEPQCRARPGGCGDGVFPDRADGIRIGDQPQLGGRSELLGERLGTLGQRPPRP